MNILEKWLTKLTAWLKEWGTWLWEGFVQVMHDVIIFWMEAILGLVSMIINELPAPDFLSQHSLSGALGATGPTVMWVIGEFRIGEGLGIIAAGFTFRVLRKFATAFQW